LFFYEPTLSPVRLEVLQMNTRLTTFLLAALVWNSPIGFAQPSSPAYSPVVAAKYPRRVYWGDLHLHTQCSADAYSLGTRHMTPADAFRFARGEAVKTETGQPTRLKRPLDFLAVTDHAEYLGAFFHAGKRTPEVMQTSVGARWAGYLANGEDRKLFTEFADALVGRGAREDSRLPDFFKRFVWRELVNEAERFNEPGRFTTIVGYEWSAAVDGNNLHRVVLFRDGPEKTLKHIPYSSLDSIDPEDLWKALEGYEKETSGRVLAIPHNGNGSNGMMFADTTIAGQPLSTDYAARRSRWEPIYEVTQVKGDGETHPYLSPNDEFADYERWDKTNIGGTRKKEPWMLEYEYARSALARGLVHESRLGVNPFAFGMIGSTDSHIGISTTTEDNFFGKFVSSEPGINRMVTQMAPGFPVPGSDFAASGLAAVWATHNTREALFDALTRKEVYATTGNRITVRLFGGWDFAPADVKRADYAAVGYSKGVPMGGTLNAAPRSKAPVLMITATKDPDEANLDRIQVIKGWLDASGKTHEKIYDVALSGKRRAASKAGKTPLVGSTVDIANATYSNSIGAESLDAVWRDPDFDPTLRAFYYVRVLEIPTPRWTAYDAKRLGATIPSGVKSVTVERAYTSPIWYKP
jgi:hypothetical protein